jgi:hypothetical protein
MIKNTSFHKRKEVVISFLYFSSDASPWPLCATVLVLIAHLPQVVTYDGKGVKCTAKYLDLPIGTTL